MLEPIFSVEPTAKFGVVSLDASQLRKRESRAPEYALVDVQCGYARGKVLEALRRRPWVRVTVAPPRASGIEEAFRTASGTAGRLAAGGLHWGDYEVLDWERVLAGEVRANAYCVRKGLSRKAQLWVYCQKHASKRPQCLLKDHMPQTLVLDLWEAYDGNVSVFGQSFGCRMPLRKRLDFALTSVREAMEAQGGFWIVKPSVTNKGSEIAVLASYEELCAHLMAWQDQREWVLQVYHDAPLLFQGRKFHLRAYVLAAGAMSVYFFNRVLLLASGRPYRREDYGNHLAHITNTAMQENDPLFDEGRCVMLLEDLEGELRQQGRPAADAARAMAELKGKLHTLTGELFEAMSGEFSVFGPLPHCFELYGIDFLVAGDLRPLLLEANPGPDFRATGERLQDIITTLFDETLTIAVERAPESASVSDAGSVGAWDAAFTQVFDTKGGTAATVSMKLT